VGECGLDSSGSGYGLVVGSCEHGNDRGVSKSVGNFLTIGVTISFSRRILKAKAVLLHAMKAFVGRRAIAPTHS
jgi:hypothetical protein